jgi:hypothetical protein
MAGLLLLFLLFAGGDVHQVLGAWEGESVCTVRDSPCHDEHVIYEIAPEAGPSNRLKMDAFKVVGGEKQFMGAVVCTYAAPTLSCTADIARKNEWTFTVEGDSMRGELRVDKERTLYRTVAVRRKGAKK